jgi:predicted RNA-binding Zn-ribbon protein involved in translation (DUF1610 family)
MTSPFTYQSLLSEADKVTSLGSLRISDQHILHSVHCPNCGGLAERHYQVSSHIVRTQCPECDYLMVMNAQSGQVIEAYAPGLYTQGFTSIGAPELNLSSTSPQINC